VETSAAGVLEIGLILVLATAAGWAARRVGLPAVLGYLAVGLVVSPFTPGYSIHRDQLQVLADVGVVLLLFEVGMEIDPLRLRHEHGALLWTVPLQTLLTAGAGTGAGLGMGLGVRGAMILGLAVALSSSVVVVNITRSRRRTTSRATEATLLGWSVLQDVCGVALAMGLLAAVEDQPRPVVLIAGGILGYVALALAAAWVLPRVLRRLRGEPDLFLMLSVAIGLAMAGLGAVVFGIPLALAAFVAGLGLGEGADAAEARRRLLPFRDLFAVMFFVAIGTLVDPRAVPDALAWTGVVLGLVVVGKVAVVYGMARALRRPGVRAWQLAAGLGQVGEFSFVLASIAVAHHLVPASLYTALLLAVVVSIAASTVLVRLGPGPGRADRLAS
jgi:monovalent cation:H+ antiporter-2, CPA2 family